MIVLGKKEFLFLFDSKKILIDGWLLWLGKMEMANSGVVQQEGYLLIQRKALVYYFKPGAHLQLAVVCVYVCMYVCMFVFMYQGPVLYCVLCTRDQYCTVCCVPGTSTVLCIMYQKQTFYLKLESSLYTNNEGLTKPILHSRTGKLSLEDWKLPTRPHLIFKNFLGGT